MKMEEDILTIFPTELAKRRYEYRNVKEHGVLDTSRVLTQAQLLAHCERAARRTGLLTGRAPGRAEMRLLSDEVVRRTPFASNQLLAALSNSARVDVLTRTLSQFAVFADHESILTQWFLAHEPTHKLHGIGQLLSTWRALCTEKNLADRFQINRALLQLLEHGELPPELNEIIHFRAVRWLNPFEERFTAALKRRLGPERVQLFSVLPAAHAEAAEDRLGSAVRSELERGNEEEWQAWLEDFADALEADDSNLLESTSKEHVTFFQSAHPYGEIEDVARRIACQIEAGTAPEQIALILRDLSPYTDIIPDVFQRFGIPYYFRRGTPAAAHPPVKALLALLAFPQTLARDRLCDLLQLPTLQWPGLDPDARQQLVEKLHDEAPPRLFRLPSELTAFFPTLKFSEQVDHLLQQHQLTLPEEVDQLLQEIREASSRPLAPEQMLSVFEELLDNITLKDEHSSESGVWIINPMDAAGLRFQSVFIAGMDDRSFPQIPQADSLINATERTALRAFLEEQKIACPRLALSEAGVALIQEEILFLTAMSAAATTLSLSYTLTDADGKERAPGEFYERMRELVGIDAPSHGESFHTILPFEHCRAEDERRQTEAKYGAYTPPDTEGSTESVQPLIECWLADHPEFSATALESLARNRFIFFLEKIVGIRPDRTHEDDTDPMDRGTLVHDILEQVYTVIAEQSGWYAQPHAGGWRIAQSGEIPLAVFDPARAQELLALAKEIAQEQFRKAEQRSSRHLGHPAVWETEKRKLIQIIENMIRLDLETAQSERRYPALFEMAFDQKHHLPLTLQHGEERIHLKGKIDRIDLIFDADGELSRLVVIDYKSKSKTDSPETIAKKTALNLDCQLAIYTFAAQQRFFGAHNTPQLNEITQAVYHLQERKRKKMTTHFQKKRLSISPELAEKFLETLFTNVRHLRAGDLSTEPLIAGYEDYSHICRAPAIDPKEWLKES